VSLVEHVVVPLARAFEPQLVLVSAGYDAHRDDLLADCTVTDEGFAAMADAVSGACESLAAPVGGVLERICARGAGTLGSGDAPGVFSAGWSRWFGTRSGGGRGAEWWPQLGRRDIRQG
jgi:hypothetical protein